MKLTDFSVLTFDCYGTLIDWETGIYQALSPLLAKHTPISRDQALETFAQEEASQEADTPDMPYSAVLTHVYQRLAKRWNVQITRVEANIFGASVPDWPAFADSAASLQYLQKYFKLVILSNVDRLSFRGSNERLQVSFDGIYTAQDIGSYKPDLRNFDYMLEHAKQDFGAAPADILHVAQSLFHDHAPANQRNLASAWIDRRHDQSGWGATMAPPGQPSYNWRFSSMTDLVKAHQEQLRQSH
jgi:2-haloacid dehalogenase